MTMPQLARSSIVSNSGTMFTDSVSPFSRPASLSSTATSSRSDTDWHLLMT